MNNKSETKNEHTTWCFAMFITILWEAAIQASDLGRLLSKETIMRIFLSTNLKSTFQPMSMYSHCIQCLCSRP